MLERAHVYPDSVREETHPITFDGEPRAWGEGTLEVSVQVRQITPGLRFGAVRPEEAAQAFAGNGFGCSSQITQERTDFATRQSKQDAGAFKLGRTEEVYGQLLALRFPEDHRQIHLRNRSAL